MYEPVPFAACIVEGSLEAKLPTIWTDGKAQPGRNSHVKKVRREKIRGEEDQRWRKSEERRCRSGRCGASRPDER